MLYSFKIFLIAALFSSLSFSQTKHLIEIKTKTENLPFGLTEEVPLYFPKVALVLSGGGARGLAQIGVLKALKEYNIPINNIVGTSVGSVVGGLFASGYTPQEMDSIAENTDWNNLLGSNREVNRRELFVDQKVTEDKAIFSLRLNGLVPILPTSINTGERLSNYLNLLVLQAPIHTNGNFDNLLYDFKAVCTDLVTGEQVVLSKGSLSQAMRASSSVSFLLSPVKIDSLILVDGGLIANIPVNIAEKDSDNYIIAVNTTSPLHDVQELAYPWNVADQIVSIPMETLNKIQIKKANYTITPKVSDISPTDFSHIDTLIDDGYESTIKKLPKIKKQIDSVYSENLKAHTKQFYIHGILIESNSSRLGKEFINQNPFRDSVSNIEIMNYMTKLVNSGNYKSVKAETDEQGNVCYIKFIAEKNPEIRNIQIKGINLFSTDRIDSIFYPLILKPYNGKIILSKILDVINLYRKRQYSMAGLDTLIFDKATGNLILVFDEGRISSIKLEGNNYTHNSVIERELPFKTGDYFIYDKISDGLVNLRSTNLFSDINFMVYKRDGKNNLVIKVSEKPSSLLSVGFRIDNEDKAQLNLDLRDENLFGSGTELGLNLLGGERNRAYILELKSNRIFNTYLTYKINGFYKFDDIYNYTNVETGSYKTFSRDVNGEYRQIYYGASVGLGTQVGKFGDLIFEGDYENEQVKNLQDSTVEPFKTKVVSLKVSTTIDTQDKYPFPTKGFYFNGFYETAQHVLGGQTGFSNIGFDYKSHFTINGASTFTPRIMMGFADNTTPLTEEYSLGGQDMFYGMRKDEFRGRQIFLTSLNYRYKLPFKIFFDTYLGVGYDLGSIWSTRQDIRFKDLRHGVGATIYFDTPIGPADFSVGKSFLFVKNLPQNPISWGDTVFYFSIGYYY
jgi:NTE family protein